jgi:murein DD-endopeptidase
VYAYEDRNHLNVISDDNRDPGVSFQHHLDRGSAGGVDHVADYGTPVYADSAGRVENLAWYGTGGNTVRLHMAGGDGWYDEYMHLSSFAVKDGATVRQGQLIGHSGASGNGNLHEYAPHLHHHRYTPGGKRVNPWDYFGGDGKTKTAGHHVRIVYTLSTGVENETFRRALLYYAHLNGYQWATSDFLSIPAWIGIQTGLEHYGYQGAKDGLPGTLTIQALQRMAHRFGSTDPIDGILSNNDRKGIAKRLNALG